ncbi:hypothetical protein [Salibacter halophilus]|uniref:Translocation protein TolB n=1 Tax=Salibacter halophilus TaxID=1803916 RepID=A0A6N6MCJ5_9FLAO|nr:hypothetical protein [Salibacter halophilus]KAB1066277.1 hypothetical protein F3059_02020 [Salibacter halophilus]
MLFTATPSSGQFYRGSYQTFGKNRVQYDPKQWEHIDFEHFNVYFYGAGRNLAVYSSQSAKRNLKQLESFFDYRLQGKVYMLVFNNLQEFRASNIGLEHSEEQNIGGKIQIQGNKIFVYYDGDHSHLDRQIRENIARVLFFQMGYGQDWKEVIKNSALLTIPDWYSEGLVSYAASPWNVEVDDRIRDIILNEEFEKFNHRTGEAAENIGHAMWHYIAQIYGEDVIPNIVYMSKISRNIENGFLYVLGVPLETLIKEARAYYQQRYDYDEKVRTLPRSEPLDIKSRKNRIYQKFTTNKSGDMAAYVTNEAGQQRVYLYDIKNDKRKKILKIGHRLDRVPELTYPLIEWHPTENILTTIYRKKGEIILGMYDVDEKEWDKRELRQLDKVLSFNYSPSGKELVFSAVSEAQTDLYLYKMLTQSQVRLTNDLFADLEPSFTADSSGIVFTSNRPTDTIGSIRGKKERRIENVQIMPTYDIFRYDYQTESEVLTRITETPQFSEEQPYSTKEGKYIYLSPKSGIMNRYIASRDSAISRIDTTIHYRYFTKSKPLTNYKRNIIHHDINPEANQVLDLIQYENKYRFYITPLENLSTLNELKGSAFNEENNQEQKDEELPERIVVQKVEVVEKEEEKEREVDIDNYRFESDNEQKPQKGSDTTQTKVADNGREPLKNSRFIELKKAPTPRNGSGKPGDSIKIPIAEIYRPAFLANDLTIQLDWNFANNLYQRFNGGPYIAPGLGTVAKTNVIDLMEDYIFEGGMRYAINGNNTEFFASFANRRKRLDKELLLQRQTTTQEVQAFTLQKTIIHKASVIGKYPFSEVAGLKGTVSYRNDQNVIQATDANSLREEDQYDHWGGLKLEYIYDNTRPLGLNLMQGTRLKVFGEMYNEFSADQGDFYVVGTDIRHYIKIHRNLIWANRLSGSTSFGSRKLVYYMGSINNWISGEDMFNFNNNVARNQGYYFQTIATPMRGFIQNARNGNSFALLNSEIRWPIFQYLISKPIKSDFLKNFQITGFGDLGTAWTGTDPYSDENAFNTREVTNGGSSVTVKLKNQIDPLIGGLGFGLRTKALGYFIKMDYAWGVENGQLKDPRPFFSLGLDF